MALIPFRFPGVDRVSCAFFTRQYGNISLETAAINDSLTSTGIQTDNMCSGPEYTRARTLRAALPGLLGVQGFAEARQVHGINTIMDAPAHNPTLPPQTEADGLASSRPGLALMIKTADCQPILLAHSSGKLVAALHAGWRGNRQNYPAVAVEQLCQHYGVNADEFYAVRGPSLGPAAAEFSHFDTEWGNAFSPWFTPSLRTMNLWKLTRHQLEQAGLRPERIFSLDLCTWSLPETFFSYRRYGQSMLQNAPATTLDGRQGSFIWIQS